MKAYRDMTAEELSAELEQLKKQYRQIQALGLHLDIDEGPGRLASLAGEGSQLNEPGVDAGRLEARSGALSHAGYTRHVLPAGRRRRERASGWHGRRACGRRGTGAEEALDLLRGVAGAKRALANGEGLQEAPQHLLVGDVCRRVQIEPHLDEVVQILGGRGGSGIARDPAVCHLSHRQALVALRAEQSGHVLEAFGIAGVAPELGSPVRRVVGSGVLDVAGVVEVLGDGVPAPSLDCRKALTGLDGAAVLYTRADGTDTDSEE